MLRLMRIQGSSMAPLLRDGHLVLLRTRTYHRHDPRRGEIVAARPAALHGKAVVKRLVGLPGERLTVDQQVWDLGDEDYLLMGDHAVDSLDSRAFGPVHRHELIGRLWLRLWPFTIFRTR